MSEGMKACLVPKLLFVDRVSVCNILVYGHVKWIAEKRVLVLAMRGELNFPCSIIRTLDIKCDKTANGSDCQCTSYGELVFRHALKNEPSRRGKTNRIRLFINNPVIQPYISGYRSCSDHYYDRHRIKPLHRAEHKI